MAQETTETRPPLPPGAIPQKQGWLMPPWAPGRSGNPSGKTKDGRPSKTAKLDALLLKRLARRRGYQRLVDRWVTDACDAEDGAVAAKAREQILARLYPVPDDPQAGRQILTGLKLELQVGKGPVTQIRGLVAQQELPAGELRGTSEQGLLEGVPQAPRIPASPQIPHDPQIQESQSLSEGTQVSGGTDGAADHS